MSISLSLALAAAAFTRIVPGALPEDNGGAFVPAADTSTSETADLPSHWDWRDQGGRSYMSPVSSQGTCGACVSFAVVSALEAALNIACDDPDRSFQLSRQFFFSCGGGACQGGLKVSEAMGFLVTTGTPDTPCLPYGAHEGQDVACASACPDWALRTIQGVSFEQPTTGFIDVAAIKRGLLRGPLVSNMILFEDLQTYQSGVYRHLTGNQIGSHAIVLTGWDDQDRAWIVRNSVGPEWGDAGYFKVAWDDASLPGRYTWLIDVTKPRSQGICFYPR